jgi:ParD-like antitoxin of type II ParDE toxin-antitoxin system
MPTVHLSVNLIDAARKYGKVLNRSIPMQLEHWMKIGKIAEENPRLSYEDIKIKLLNKKNDEDN